jgi:D-3-phosphoglycerate dehydrogenase
MPSIIVLDTLSPDGLALLEAAAAHGITYEVATGLSGDALREALARHDGAICRSGVKITAESLAGNQRLKAIVRAGVGTDNIDKDAATRQGIVVMNTPAGNTVSTAEHAFALLLALSRNIAAADASLHAHRWDRNKFMGVQVAGKTLGIVGLGRIGQTVAARARAFEMRVLGFDPFLSVERAAELGIELVPSVHAMLPEVDYLTVHTPLTAETKYLVGMKELDLLKPGVRLINCARGGIYDEKALAEGLDRGVIAGVALDVFEKEPCTESPLFDKPGVLVTPHLGASTEEAQSQVAVEGVGLLVDFLATGAIRHSVNSSPIDPASLEGVKGFLDLAWRRSTTLRRVPARSPIGVKSPPGRRSSSLPRSRLGSSKGLPTTSTLSTPRSFSGNGASIWSNRAGPIPAPSVPSWPSTSSPRGACTALPGRSSATPCPGSCSSRGIGSRPTSTGSC